MHIRAVTIDGPAGAAPASTSRYSELSGRPVNLRRMKNAPRPRSTRPTTGRFRLMPARAASFAQLIMCEAYCAANRASRPVWEAWRYAPRIPLFKHDSMSMSSACAEKKVQYTDAFNPSEASIRALFCTAWATTERLSWASTAAGRTCGDVRAGEPVHKQDVAQRHVVQVALVRGHKHDRVRRGQRADALQPLGVHIDARAVHVPGTNKPPIASPLLDRLARAARSCTSAWSALWPLKHCNTS